MPRPAREYEQVRQDYVQRRQESRFVSIAEARERGLKTDWTARRVTRPSFLGERAFPDFDLADLIPFIDWSPFFMAWELKGVVPQDPQGPQGG